MNPNSPYRAPSTRSPVARRSHLSPGRHSDCPSPPSGRRVRCKSCGALLCVVGDEGLEIARGGQTTRITGSFALTISCYAPSCGAENVLGPIDTGPRN